MVEAHVGWAVSLHQREYGHRLIAHPSIECLRRHHAVLPDVGSTECGRSRAGVFDRKHATEQKYEWLLRPRFKLPIHHLWDVAGPLGFLTSDRRCPTAVYLFVWAGEKHHQRHTHLLKRRRLNRK